MTLTGCVRTWDPATMTVATSPATGPARAFVLTDVAAASTAPATTPPGAPAPPGTDAPPKAAGAHGTYLLSPAPPSINLSTYLGQRVEATGVLKADPSAALTPATPRPSASARPSTTGATSPRTPSDPLSFAVTAIKVVAKTCS